MDVKKLSPTRLIKNEFYQRVQEAEDRGANSDELREILGKGRSKKGIFEGNLVDGELEIGQVASLLNDIPSVESVVNSIISEFNDESKKLSEISF